MNKALVCTDYEERVIDLRVSAVLPAGLSREEAILQLRRLIAQGSCFCRSYIGEGDRPCVARAKDVRIHPHN